MAIPNVTLGLKTLFFVLSCLMIITLIYTISIDGLPFRRDLLTPWMSATLVDFYINVVPIAAWTSYKESNRLIAIIWIVLLICFGSITTCAYIFVQFLKLLPEECFQDPMYHVLVRLENKDGGEQKKNFSVVTARIAFSILGCLMLGTLIYTISTDCSPFRKEVLTPLRITKDDGYRRLEGGDMHGLLLSTERGWMVATLIDFYINVVALSVWVAYKESCSILAFLWITLFICFGSISTCAYIFYQLLQLTSQDPLYLVLLRRDNRAEKWYERT